MDSIMIDRRRAVGSPSFEYLVRIVGKSLVRKSFVLKRYGETR